MYRKDTPPSSKPLPPRELRRKGERLMREGAWSDALDAFEAALQSDPRNARAYWGRGVCRYQLGAYRRAAEDMDAAALLGCRDAQLWSRFDVGAAEDDEDGENDGDGGRRA